MRYQGGQQLKSIAITLTRARLRGHGAKDLHPRVNRGHVLHSEVIHHFWRHGRIAWDACIYRVEWPGHQVGEWHECAPWVEGGWHHRSGASRAGESSRDRAWKRGAWCGWPWFHSSTALNSFQMVIDVLTPNMCLCGSGSPHLFRRRTVTGRRVCTVIPSMLTSGRLLVQVIVAFRRMLCTGTTSKGAAGMCFRVPLALARGRFLNLFHDVSCLFADNAICSVRVGNMSNR